MVLCQMVPFAEVVLLTAMEYQREDDTHGGDGKNDWGIDEVEEKEGQRFWVPRLKTIGDIPDAL